MFNLTTQRLKNTSQLLVGEWARHEKAMEEAPLVYLDNLLDALAAKYGQDPVTLAKKLYVLVPELQYGTARRLVRLKFGDVAVSTDHPVVTTTFLQH